jgi:D-aminopeptidase
VPVGKEIPQDVPYARNAPGAHRRIAPGSEEDVGSIIILVATDAPLLPHQLKRIARRATMGLARTGSISGNGSGDLFLAFSTAARITSTEGVSDIRMLANDSMNPLFEATVQATEEAIVNAMVASDTMTGIDGHRVIGLPHDQLIHVLEKYNRISR